MKTSSFFPLQFFFIVLLFQFSFCEIIPSGNLIQFDPGIPGGIPNIQAPIESVLDHGAVADGITNDLPAFETALDALTDGGVLFVPAGNYFLDGSLTIGKNDIVLRGEGADKSKLYFGSATNGSITVITYGRGDWQTLTSSLSRGSKTITVPNGSAFTVGEFAEIQKENDADLMYTDPEWNQSYAQNARGQMFEVTQITGNQITFAHALYLDYPISDNPQIRPQRFVKNVGIEDLYLERLDGNSDVATIYWKNAAYVWAKNLESSHTVRAHIGTESVIGCQVQNSVFHHSFNYGGGGHGYGVSFGFHTSDCLVENNIFYHLRHSMIVSKGTSGSVFGYNFSTETRQGENGETDLNDVWIPPDISIHGHWSNNNLFESNTIQQLGIADYWGPTGPNVAYVRNRVVNDQTELDGSIDSRSIQLDDHSNYQYLIGNVMVNGILETDGTPDMSTNIIHGLVSSTDTTWNANISDYTIPTSYYWNCRPNFLASTNWPFIGPDVEFDKSPAQLRYESSNYIASDYTRDCADSSTSILDQNEKFVLNQSFNLTLVNSVGKIIYHKIKITNDLEVPTSQLKNGLYFAIFSTDKKVIRTQKLTVIH